MATGNSNLETRNGKPDRAGRRARAVVDLGALARNYRFLAARVAPAEVIAVVKADAYGHGAVPVARRLEAEGADSFAVAFAEEGVELRKAGIRGEILLLSFADPGDLPLFRAYGLTPALYDLEQARAFAEAARGLAPPLPVHVKIDTGMGRLGIPARDLPGAIALLRRAAGLAVGGVYSNLSSSGDPASPVTAAQAAALRTAVAAFRAAGLGPGRVHLANSGAVLSGSGIWFDAIRPGLALYGVLPSERLDGGALEPALAVETEIMTVKDVAAGTPIGYGGAFVTQRPSRIAALPIGYDDGLRRSFSGRLSVLVRGEQTPIVGAVSMDLTMIDVTGVAARPGDRVVCLGCDGQRRVTAWNWAEAAGTIPYEVLCGIGSRVPRAYTT